MESYQVLAADIKSALFELEIPPEMRLKVSTLAIF